MFSPQDSFSVHSFPLKPVEQSSQGASWSSNDALSRNLPNSPQSAVAGPSTSPVSQATPSLTSPEGSVVNFAAYPKNRTDEELQVIQQTAAGFAACLAADHAAVLYPDVDTPFMDAADVVNRLLPYHVFQQPDEDLKSLLDRKRSKGKEKAKHDELREEIEETRFALSCHRRLKILQDRFRRAKIKTGTRPSPDDQGYILAQSILEVERSETAAVSSELRSARNELDAIQREKRAMTATAAAHPTVTTFRPAYYQPATPSTYYRTYPYAYTQPYSTAGATTSTFYSAPPTTAQPPVAGTSYTPSTSPIPVQLPVTSLSALHALGIVPIPATSLPPPDQPQPAAVLKGSTSNGAMLSLEINVSLLQSGQMSGLAVLLNSLMSRGVGSGQAVATATARSSEQTTGQAQQSSVTPAAASTTPVAIQKEGDGTG
ncbi:hypothetical protein HYDPIDRAFT_116082 [Hydnomerulius pinastri MD-312]|uniref:GLTSCR protein conserved domain-containing protein n=1 Tax=Hydnomerulius pinastri MD-312 TaxID=994086 RepID=A0A0C9VTJ9_9AGAM|nr:hypothetical protein HYDPIDRAFT_116082 [Hydnomerulius pinastri MD-312]